MKIIINTSTVAVGGGLTEALNLLHWLKNQSSSHEIWYFSPYISDFKRFDSESLTWIPVPRILLKRIFRPILDCFWLPKKVKALSPDWVYTLGNLPARLSWIKQAFLLNNPFITVKSFSGLNLSFSDILIHKIRKKVFLKRIKYLNLIFTQTDLQKQKIMEHVPKNMPVVVLPNATISLPQKKKMSISLPKKVPNEIRLLVFSRYYPHKNLEILYPLADLLKKEGKTIRFILTIDPDQDSRARRFLEKAGNNNFNKYFINVGYVPPVEIEALYAHADGLLLPTLQESFSSTYIDAMTFSKPILTSNLNFAKEICKDSAWYFDPYSANNILETIVKCFSKHNERKNKIKIGKQIAKNAPTWKENCNFIFKSLKEYKNG